MDHLMPEQAGTAGRIDGRCVGHRVEIGAPPELVWDFVSDFEGWAEWNPLYIETSGRAEPGSEIRYTVRLEGLKPQKAAARVSTVRPNEAFEYGMSALGGLLKVLRFVTIEEISPTRCVVINGEIMGGPVGRMLSRAMGPRVGKGLDEMNQALRHVAELKWRGQQSASAGGR